jgi:SNF2 family DNA or RNA helicase
MRALTDATAGLLKPLPIGSNDRLFISIDKDLKKFVARIGCDEHWRFPTLAARKTWLSRVPERKHLEDKGQNVWELGATDYTAVIIDAVWPRAQIIFEDDKAATVFEYLLLSVQMQDANSEAYGRFKELGELPKGADEIVWPANEELKAAPYQRCALWCAMRSEGYAYFMEQGTGKTPLVIAEICNLAAQRNDWTKPFTALICPPKNVRINWVREFEKFATVPGKVTVIRGGAIKRLSAIIETQMPEQDCLYNVCVMSYEAMTRDVDTLVPMDWDMVALDEGHMIKYSETKRCKAAFKMRDVARRRRLLTGTPICNSQLDLYSLFEFLGEGWSGFRSWHKFREFYGVFTEPEGDAYKKLVGVQNLPFMKERLSRLSFIIRKDEALPDLPSKVYDCDEVEMTAEQEEAYRRIAEEMIYSLESELEDSDNKAMTINNILTKLLRLAQIACGYVVWDQAVDLDAGDVKREKELCWFAEDPKLERLVEILKEKKPNEKTIVWSCFVPCIKKISQRLSSEGIDHVTFYGGTSEDARLEAERRFNLDPACRVFLGNPAAGGVGLNLPGSDPNKWGTPEDLGTDADHVIYYAQDWSFVKRSQSEDRCHGFKRCRKQIRVTDLVVPETIDEDIRVRVLKKKMLALEISDIREILQAVIHGLKVSTGV